MISKRTTAEVLRTVENWAKEYQVQLPDVAELFNRLSQVEGNQSFKDSVEGLRELLWRRITGERS